MTDFAEILMRGIRQGEARAGKFIGQQAGGLKERVKQGLHAAWIAPTNWVGAHAGDLALAKVGIINTIERMGRRSAWLTCFF